MVLVILKITSTSVKKLRTHSVNSRTFGRVSRIYSTLNLVKRKLIRCTKTVVPDGNVEEQMREIKQYYIGFKGKHPENFTIGETN